ncbi:peptidoglycan DD-metalloendopeptidase family protein [Chloroflexota bacterium]
MEENISTNTQSETKGPTRKAGVIIQQVGINMLIIGLLALLAFLAWQKFMPQHPTTAAILPESAQESGAGGPIKTDDSAAPQEQIAPIELLPFATPISSHYEGVFRQTNLKTIIPTRPRVNVITYTVEKGDTLFSIAGNYGLNPETVLWGNFEVLEDNPHLLAPNQILNILPIDGTYYQWEAGDTLGTVSEYFKVEPKNILNYPGNDFDLTELDQAGENISSGTWLIIPDGKREIKDWGPPAISRQNPASARSYGPGACADVYSGAYGTGTFIWPTTDRSISGYNYSPGVHPAIDIGGQEGNPVYASDSGVIVYAGWSDYGYGYLIVVDHGNGWQSAYAHLSAVAVGCGQSVYQGGYIGALGSTGNSSGPHLHFELAINGVKVNPLDYAQ